jgi:hypothetical protein
MPIGRLAGQKKSGRRCERREQRRHRQVVTAWLGTTPAIAMRHNLMTTEKHFEAAAEVSIS